MRRVIGLSVIGFFGAFGVTLGLRLSEGVLAVLAGVLLGGGLVVAMGGVVAWVVVRERREERYAPLPPSVVTTWRQVQAQPALPPTQRQFYLIGESGEVTELMPEAEPHALLERGTVIEP